MSTDIIIYPANKLFMQIENCKVPVFTFIWAYAKEGKNLISKYFLNFSEICYMDLISGTYL